MIQRDPGVAPSMNNELIAALRLGARSIQVGGIGANALIRLADALEAAGDGPFVIDATGAVLGTLEQPAGWYSDRYRLRPSLTEDPV